MNNSIILIVDDEPTNLGLLHKILSNEGYKVLIAHNGLAAFEILKNQQVDLILLDILMPEMDGYKTSKLIRSDSNLETIPIIFMSALSDLNSKIKGFESGGVDYIMKPFQKEEILARISTHLILKKQRKELSEINANKDRLISVMSHDLRSPFMSLIEFGSLLANIDEEITPTEIREIGKKIYETGRSTLKLLENLLDWTRVQQTINDLELENLNLYDIVVEDLVLFKQQILHKGITIKNLVNKSTEILSDEYLTHAIFRNIISNAIKFSNENGTIEINNEEFEKFIRIDFTDYGVGIEKDEYYKLFNLKEKISKPGTLGEKGSGLGLLLCKEFLNKMKGDIRITSEKDKGTKVSIIFQRVSK